MFTKYCTLICNISYFWRRVAWLHSSWEFLDSIIKVYQPVLQWRLYDLLLFMICHFV